MKTIGLIITVFLISCVHTGVRSRYKFTCPDGSIVHADVTQDELSGDADYLYDKIVDICRKAVP